MPRNSQGSIPEFDAHFAAHQVAAVARELRLDRKHVREVVEHFLEVLRDDVWLTGRVAIPRFGVFRVKRKKARRVKNPNGPELLWLPEHEAVSFRASKNWRVR